MVAYLRMIHPLEANLVKALEYFLVQVFEQASNTAEKHVQTLDVYTPYHERPKSPSEQLLLLGRLQLI
jgi:hypothetical protein